MMKTVIFALAMAATISQANAQDSGPGGASGPGGSGGGGGNGGSAELAPSPGKADAFLNPTLFPPTIYGAVRARDMSRAMLNPSTPVLVTDLDHSQPTYFERWQAAHKPKMGGGFGGYEE